MPKLRNLRSKEILHLLIIIGFDGTFYPPNMETVPRRYAIVRANRYMVTISDYLDAGYVGNTRELVAFARRREKRGKIRIANLANM